MNVQKFHTLALISVSNHNPRKYFQRISLKLCLSLLEIKKGNCVEIGENEKIWLLKLQICEVFASWCTLFVLIPSNQKIRYKLQLKGSFPHQIKAHPSNCSIYLILTLSLMSHAVTRHDIYSNSFYTLSCPCATRGLARFTFNPDYCTRRQGSLPNNCVKIFLLCTWRINSVYGRIPTCDHLGHHKSSTKALVLLLGF